MGLRIFRKKWNNQLIGPQKCADNIKTVYLRHIVIIWYLKLGEY